MKKILFVIFFFLSGCNISHTIPDNFDPNSIPEGHGVVIGSFTQFPGSHVYNTYVMRLRAVDPEMREHIKPIIVDTEQGGWSLQFPSEIFELDSVGTKWLRVLPEGEYEFFNYGVYSNEYLGDRSWSAKEDFSIKFKVEEGKVNYVGEFKNISMRAHNLFFGYEMTHGAIFSLLDKNERDIPLIKNAYPDLNWNNLQINVPFVGERVRGIVYFEPLGFGENKTVITLKDEKPVNYFVE